MAVGFRFDFPEIGGRAVALLLLAGACRTAEPAAALPPDFESGQEPAPADPAGREEAGPELAELRAAAAADPETALARYDASVGLHGGSAEFWQDYGDATLALFERGLAAGSPNGFLPADAEALYLNSLDREPGRRGARFGLARARRLAGDVSGAWDAAFALWQGAGGPAAPSAELEEIGRAGLAVTLEALQRGEPAPAVARVAEQALGAALAAGRGGAAAPLFDLHAWQQQWEAAAASALRGLRADPPAEELYARLRALSGAQRNLHVATLEELRRARPGDGVLLWYLGEALFFQGREARSAFDTLKARECFDRADEAFAQAQSARSDFAGSCQEWQHLIRVQRAWVARDEGRAAAAADLAVAALSAAPQRLEAEPDPDSLRLAIEAIAADLFQAPDLAAARGFLARVLEIHPDVADWQNNLAFFCRELGVAAAETGDPAAAGYFEESWAHYSRAAELAPEDARILNDRALIAVYYLDEHWDLAERELHKAIEVGTRQLAEMPPDVPGSERRYVDEAVGDAWENLAYLRLVRRRQTEGVEDFLRRSSEHYPFERRAGVARLREALEAAAHHP